MTIEREKVDRHSAARIVAVPPNDAPTVEDLTEGIRDYERPGPRSPRVSGASSILQERSAAGAIHLSRILADEPRSETEKPAVASVESKPIKSQAPGRGEPDLQLDRLIDAWPALPLWTRRAILAMVEDAVEQVTQRS